MKKEINFLFKTAVFLIGGFIFFVKAKAEFFPL